MDLNNPLQFLLFFVGTWLAALLAVSLLSGWAELARVYRSPRPFEGPRWRFESARMRLSMNYNRCLTVGANGQGLYLSLLFLFRFGHPALFIPWNEVAVVREGRTFWWKWSEFRFRQAPWVYIRLGERISQQIKVSAGTAWASTLAQSGTKY